MIRMVQSRKSTNIQVPLESDPRRYYKIQSDRTGQRNRLQSEGALRECGEDGGNQQLTNVHY